MASYDQQSYDSSYDKRSYSDYSDYKTKDKKYECKTGPFEGFFTSSVEFCFDKKFNDDKKRDHKDNRDNRTGPQGPQGPQGSRSQGIPGHKVHQDLMEQTVLMEQMELMEQTLIHVLHVF